MEAGTRYTRACNQVVNTHQTIENWRNKKPLLDRYFLKLLYKRDERITDAVEDKLSDRLVKGEATPTEYIFYLVNRRPKKWQNNYRVEHSGEIKGAEVRIILINPKEVKEKTGIERVQV